MACFQLIGRALWRRFGGVVALVAEETQAGRFAFCGAALARGAGEAGRFVWLTRIDFGFPPFAKSAKGWAPASRAPEVEAGRFSSLVKGF